MPPEQPGLASKKPVLASEGPLGGQTDGWMDGETYSLYILQDLVLGPLPRLRNNHYQ